MQAVAKAPVIWGCVLGLVEGSKLIAKNECYFGLG